MSLTSSADSHLIGINYLIEPYRVPQKATTVPVTRSVKPVPSYVEDTVNRGKPQDRRRESENLAFNQQRDYADGAKIVVADKLSHDKVIIHAGDSQDADYDENMEVELDKEDVKLVRPRLVETEYEIQQNAMITSSSLPRILVSRPSLLFANQRQFDADPDSIRVLFKYNWFFLVVAVFLLSFWLRCMRCVRCGFLLRRCRWLCSLTD